MSPNWGFYPVQGSPIGWGRTTQFAYNDGNQNFGTQININNFWGDSERLTQANDWGPRVPRRHARVERNCFDRSPHVPLTASARKIDDNQNGALDSGAESLDAAFKIGTSINNGKLKPEVANQWKEVLTAINDGRADQDPNYRQKALESLGTYLS